MKVTLLEREGVTTFVVLSLMGEANDGKLSLFMACVIGMFKIWFDTIVNVKRINKVPVILVTCLSILLSYFGFNGRFYF